MKAIWCHLLPLYGVLCAHPFMMFFFATIARTHSLSLPLSIVMSCLKLLAVHIPPSVSEGDTVTLDCIYDLQGSPLYSLKWHKDGREFFRLYRNTSPTLLVTSPMPPTPPFNQMPPPSGKASRRKNQKSKQHHITQQHNLYQQQMQSNNNIQLTPMLGIDVDVSVPCACVFTHYPLQLVPSVTHSLTSLLFTCFLPPLPSAGNSSCIVCGGAGSELTKRISRPTKRYSCLLRTVQL